MGLMDNLKGRADELKEKAGELAGKHNDKIEGLVDKAGAAVDKATKHKYSQSIEQSTAKAKHLVEDMAAKHPHGPAGETPTEGTPPEGGPTA